MFKNKKDKKKQQETTVANAVISGGVAVETAGITTKYNSECEAFRMDLAEKTVSNQKLLDEKLKVNPEYMADRGKGVSSAYEYEVADVKMGGSGSANWNRSQKAELLDMGKVRGAEGHHINSVAKHPEKQTNPDNIKFYKDRNSHLNDGHGGDFHNASVGKLENKDQMLERTNRRRVIKNEGRGFLLATSTGAFFGLLDSVVCACKEEGKSMKSVKKGIKKSKKRVVESAAVAAGSYGLTRIATLALNKLFK